MALVEFENDKEEEFHIRSPKISLFGDPETPTLIKLLLKFKVVKTERQAFYVLIGFIIVAAIIVFIIQMTNFRSKEDVYIDPQGNKSSIEQYLQEIKTPPRKDEDSF
ncbi:hypothetical protein H0W32_02125 [Patescibacteria group bacterium]|nr:hypothetical protein [Patescibacteria group bacterium]